MAVTAGRAQAALITIGTADYKGGSYNLIYDNAGPLGSIVWLDYTHGPDTWNNQVSWASGLNAAGTIDYHLNLGVSINWGTSSWRLPSTVDDLASFGFDHTTSEMGHLYYTELGKSAGGGLGDPAPFTSLLQGWYWSGTELAIDQSQAWRFQTDLGYQYWDLKDYTYFALAVRPGQLEAVPEPYEWAAISFGVLGLVFAAKRRLAKATH